MGPIDLLVVKFPGNQFRGEIAPRLADLIRSGTIRIIDLVFVGKDPEGNIVAFEINDLPGGQSDPWTGLPIETDESVGLNDDDIQQLASGLEPNSSGAILLFENTWAMAFKQALENAQAEVLLFERIPGDAVELLAAEASGGAA